MLVAIDVMGNRVALLDELPHKTRQYFCPVCRGQVILKNGPVKQAHFAHKNALNCSHNSDNESQEHLLLKASLYKNLIQAEDVKLESYFPEIHQLADLQVNNKLVLEVQCSSLPCERLKKRSIAYRRQDQIVFWLLGKNLWLKNRLTTLQRQFLSFSWEIGFYLWEIDLNAHCLRLHFMIHEDLMGKVTCLTRKCSLDEDLMAFFRLPFQKLCFKPLVVTSDHNLLVKIQKALRYKDKNWLIRQEQAYLSGSNLLNLSVDDFYPQFHPPTCQQGFSQIDSDLEKYYEAFHLYYKEISNKTVQTLHPPDFYVKI